MKKLILLFVLISSFAKAQGPYTYIWSSNADTVSIGDSCWIDIGYGHGSIDDSTNVFLQMTGNLNIAAHYTYGYLDTITKVYDSVYHGMLARIHFIMPAGTQIGAINYFMNFQYFPVYVRDTTTSTVGIATYSLSRTVKEVHYYTELGQEIQRPNESTSGLVIFRTLYTDGSVEVKKKYFLN